MVLVKMVKLVDLVVVHQAVVLLELVVQDKNGLPMLQVIQAMLLIKAILVVIMDLTLDQVVVVDLSGQDPILLVTMVDQVVLVSTYQ